MLLQQLINGLTIGCSYALVTLGFSMIYSVLELTNFAHSSYYMLGGYLVLSLMNQLGRTPGMLLVGVILCAAVCGVISAGVDRLTLRKIRKSKSTPISALLCTLGVQTIINNAIIAVYGSESRKFPDVLNLGQFHLGNAVVSWFQIVMLCVAVVIMTILSIVVYKTKFGAGMRAISQNARAAKMMGVRVESVISWTFFISAVVSAISGVMVGMYYQAVETTMATVVGNKAFAAAVLGGIGELPGAVMGGLIIGVLEAITASYISSGYRDAIAFAVLIIVLIVRPRGIMGKKVAEKV